MTGGDDADVDLTTEPTTEPTTDPGLGDPLALTATQFYDADADADADTRARVTALVGDGALVDVGNDVYDVSGTRNVVNPDRR